MVAVRPVEQVGHLDLENTAVKYSPPAPPLGRVAIASRMAVKVWEEVKYTRKEDDRTLLVL